MYALSIYFLIFAFLGWISEVCFAAYKHGKFVNRGFLNGPVCPIYGFGVAGVRFVVGLISNDAVLVVTCFLLPSVLELITGFVLEKVFHNKWWDYSKERWNVGGYICAKFSLIWGLVCIAAVKIIFPLIDSLIAVLPKTATIIVVCVLLATMLVDFIGTIFAVVKMNVRLKAIDALNEKIHSASDKIGQGVADGTLALINAKEKVKSEASIFTKRLVAAFPDMKSKKYRSLNELRESLKKRKEKNTEPAAIENIDNGDGSDAQNA